MNTTKILTKEDYERVKNELDSLISEATRKGLLESDADNEYTRKIVALAELMAEYEDTELKVTPLRVKNPLIRSIEDYLYAHSMRNKDGAKALGLTESAFSQIMSGKRRISLSIAKKLKSIFGIDANLILDYA